MNRRHFSVCPAGPVVTALLFAACCSTKARNEISYRSDPNHLQVTLPPGWAAAEGPERLARPFVGLVAFNSWGEPSFWAPEVATETAGGTSYTYGPEDILGQIPDGGAYVVLVHFGGGPHTLAEAYGPEYEPQDLHSLWEQRDCREGKNTRGVTYIDLFKWGRLLRLEVYCGQNVSDATAAAVNDLLESWRFDSVPVGDTGWAVVEARRLLPPTVAPEKFPVPPGSFRSQEQEDATVRIAQAEVQDETVVVTFMYRWNEPQSGTSSEERPSDRCRLWKFEARPDGDIVLIEERGAVLPGGTPTSGPTPTKAAPTITPLPPISASATPEATSLPPVTPAPSPGPLPFPTPSVTEWQRIGDDWWKYSFEVPASWLLSEPGMTIPDRLVFFSDTERETGMMKLDFGADPLAKPDPPDVSGWETITVAGTLGWMATAQGGEASGPYDVWTTVYIPGSEYRYALSLFCAPPDGAEEQGREQFIAECQGVLGHILASFQIMP